jgi:metallo-beta-lactamase family protein
MEISFLGAARNVTGSKYLLEANGGRFLVDCGLFQERDFKGRNWESLPFPADELDAVLLTHAHLDHCGLLPRLVREGFHGKIYATGATRDIAEIVLLDAARIQEEDAANKRRRHEKEGRRGPYPEVALYGVEDAERSVPFFEPVDYGDVVQIGEGVEATFCDAGHILGSAMIRITVRERARTRSVLFSGDIGRWNMPILRDPTLFEAADYVIMESTYGDREHEDPKDKEELLSEAVNSAYRSGGNIIIPSFAVGRTQEILFHLNELLLEDSIPHLLVFVDSPMANRVTGVFRRHLELMDSETSELIARDHSPFDLPNLKMVSSVAESKAINHVRGTAIIIAGSGMCTGGRIKHHLVHNISRRESVILFVGYQAAGTLGREIVDGAGQVRILGQKFNVRAKVVRINGFSAHADKNELARWAAGLKRPPRCIFVTHGEPEAAQKLAEHLRQAQSGEVVVPEYGETRPLT